MLGSEPQVPLPQSFLACSHSSCTRSRQRCICINAAILLVEDARLHQLGASVYDIGVSPCTASQSSLSGCPKPHLHQGALSRMMWPPGSGHQPLLETPILWAGQSYACSKQSNLTGHGTYQTVLLHTLILTVKIRVSRLDRRASLVLARTVCGKKSNFLKTFHM